MRYEKSSNYQSCVAEKLVVHKSLAARYFEWYASSFLELVITIMQIPTRVKRLFVGDREPQLTCISSTEAPRLALTDVETRMNMGALFKDHTSPDKIPNGAQRMHSSPVLSTGRWTISASEIGAWIQNQIKTFI